MIMAMATLSYFRVDGLFKREESPTEMKEHFMNREDYLHFRHVYFGKRQKKAGPASSDGTQRPILVRKLCLKNLYPYVDNNITLVLCLYLYNDRIIPYKIVF